MENPKDESLKDLKKQLDETLGDNSVEILRDISLQLEQQVEGISKLLEQVSKAPPEDKTEEKLTELKEAIKALNTSIDEKLEAVASRIKDFPTEIGITNVKDFEEFLNIGKALKESIIIPEKFEISNLKEIKFPDLEALTKALQKLAPPDEITIKKPKWYKEFSKEDLADVLVQIIAGINKGDGLKVDLDKYRDANKPLSVRLSNGKDFYTAFAEAIISSGRSSFPFKKVVNGKAIAQEALVDDDGHQQVDILTMPPITVGAPDNFNANHLDDFTTANVTYVGTEDSTGVWLIKKIDESGSFPVITYAGVSNNPTLTTYALAWADRVTASYDTYADVV